MTASSDLQLIDLVAEIDHFPPHGSSGRRAETLRKTSDLRVVLVTMRSGAELREHVAPGTITVQPLRGLFAFTVADNACEITVGDLITLDAGVRHAVRAIDDGAFLLTIAWPGDDPDTGDPLGDIA